MKQLFLLFFCFISISAAAQKFQISGTLIDKNSKAPLESATIFVEHISDSSLVAYTISDQNGEFELKGTDDSLKLRFVATYAGYKPLTKIVQTEKETIDLGILQMEVATNELGEVMVVADRAPITIKNDTLEFNAASFKTRPDANLEDVLEKLPGVEVDQDGNITVNGKPVSRILVNGEEFFGNDPKIASKNLPKEIIDKIQVVNTKTKAEEFTGKAGDPDNKTINITIDEDKNHGYFARATAGGGTDERYEMSGIANYFKDDLRISVLASSNNINSAGFSFSEIQNMIGNVRSITINSNGNFSVNGNRFGSAGGGITKSETAGLNFSNKWNDTYELNANYFFGKNDTETKTEIQQINFLPGSTYYSNAVSEGNLVNNSHRASGTFEVEFDTLTKLSIRPAVRIDNGFSRRENFEETLDENRELTNSSTTLDNEEFDNINFSNRINFIRRFGGRGAFLQATFNNENERRESNNYFLSERLIFENGEVAENNMRNQLIDEENESDEYNFEISQRSVLMTDFFLDLSYKFNIENSSNTRNVFNFNQQTKEYDLFNETLSNAFEVNSIEHIPNVGLNYEGEKMRIGFNIGLLNTSLETENFIADVSFDNTYNNLYINSSIRYEIKKGTSVFLSYSNGTDIPSIRQLQPVEDVTNPLNIVVGNPKLKPSFTQNFYFRLNNFDFASRTGIFSGVSLSLTEDEVVPYILTNEDLVRTTTFRNVDGGISLWAYGNYRKTIKVEKTEYSYSLGANASYNKEIGFSNGIKFTANNLRAGPGISFGYNYNDMVEIEPSYDLNYVFTSYDIIDDREEEYVNHSIKLEATSYWPKNWVYGNDISYNYFGNTAPGFDNTSLLWNMSLGYKFLDDDATLELRVYDLLNENISTQRTTGQDFIRDERSLILEQYFMLSFTYKLSKFGGKDPNENGMMIFD